VVKFKVGNMYELFVVFWLYSFESWIYSGRKMASC
jgi:hypothetical protein